MEQPKIFHYDTVDSTNTVCKSLAAQGAPSGTAVIAGGRRRAGAAWAGALNRRRGWACTSRCCGGRRGRPEDLLPLTPMAAVSAAGPSDA